MPDAEWAAWLARPIAEREAIQDKVRAALKTNGIQAGRHMQEALGMPRPPAHLMAPVAVLEGLPEQEDDGDLWEPVGRMEH